MCVCVCVCVCVHNKHILFPCFSLICCRYLSTVPLRNHSTVTLRVEDDAFIKVCDMINDSSVAVRALAATLLGKFRSVSQQFLDQTLDKKLMSHLRVVKSEHERAKELHQAGGTRDWDTGQKWGGGIPKIDFDPSEISLMSAGACGAFVHSLEDEYYEVRSAAVESMGQLGQQSTLFASQCLDFLVDLFNDEIVSVRLKAIRCLQKVSSHIELREDQLETVLGVLEESSREIRTALHELLSSCHITSSAGLDLTLHALLNNLKRYPLDCQSVWKCLQVLGGSHAHLVATMVPQLLSTHPFFMSKEPDVDDPACILPSSHSFFFAVSLLSFYAFLNHFHTRYLCPHSCVQCCLYLLHHPSSLPKSCVPTLFLSS